MTTFRWGFVGAGRIAATVAGDLALTPGGERFAVASRDGERAAQFAQRHGFARSYGSYEALVADPEVDVVYVATPHSHHLGAASLALRAGKPVLVEKPFTTTADSARELVDLAGREGLFCMEALWTRFLPNTVHLLDLLATGRLGEVRGVQASIGWKAPADPAGRLLDPALGGGALLDAGVYGVWLADLLLGPATDVQAAGRLGATGVDLEASLLLTHAGGGTSQVTASIDSVPSGTAWVQCADGAVQVPASFETVPGLVVHRPGAEPVPVDHGRTGRGYAHMLSHVQACLADGLTQSPLVPLDTTLRVLTVLDTARRLLGAGGRSRVAGCAHA